MAEAKPHEVTADEFLIWNLSQDGAWQDHRLTAADDTVRPLGTEVALPLTAIYDRVPLVAPDAPGTRSRRSGSPSGRQRKPATKPPRSE